VEILDLERLVRLHRCARASRGAATSDGVEAGAPWGKGVRRATVPGAPG
jgi:hypothetical protein